MFVFAGGLGRRCCFCRHRRRIAGNAARLDRPLLHPHEPQLRGEPRIPREDVLRMNLAVPYGVVLVHVDHLAVTAPLHGPRPVGVVEEACRAPVGDRLDPVLLVPGDAPLLAVPVVVPAEHVPVGVVVIGHVADMRRRMGAAAFVLIDKVVRRLPLSPLAPVARSVVVVVLVLYCEVAYRVVLEGVQVPVHTVRPGPVLPLGSLEAVEIVVAVGLRYAERTVVKCHEG